MWGFTWTPNPSQNPSLLQRRILAQTAVRSRPTRDPMSAVVIRGSTPHQEYTPSGYIHRKMRRSTSSTWTSSFLELKPPSALAPRAARGSASQVCWGPGGENVSRGRTLNEGYRAQSKCLRVVAVGSSSRAGQGASGIGRQTSWCRTSTRSLARLIQFHSRCLGRGRHLPTFRPREAGSTPQCP